MDLEPLYTIRGPKTLFEMTWEEVKEALEKTDIVLVPVGAVEQHGPHLPLGADSMQGIDFCRRMVALLDSRGISVVAGPPILYGISASHMAFPGTVGLTPKTMLAVIEETCLCLYEHGFHKIALIMGHGGNWPVMQLAVQSLMTKKPDISIIALNWLSYMKEKYPEILTSKRTERHSGEGETSRMLATVPELVEMNRARVFYPETPSGKPLPHPTGIFTTYRDIKQLTPVGSMGNPTLATAETGEKIYDLIVSWLADAIEQEFLTGQ